MGADAVALVRAALAGSGVDLCASSPVAALDRVAPPGYRSGELLAGARGLIVAGSAGPALWRAFRAHLAAHPERLDAPDPYDAFVATRLDRADAALRGAGIRHRRFEAAVGAAVRLDFVALGRVVGLGQPSPFALLVHDAHGPWWALRGAWLVDAEVAPPRAPGRTCEGCAAPCVGGEPGLTLARATPVVRSRCVVGQASRYDPEQIAFHEDPVGQARVLAAQAR